MYFPTKSSVDTEDIVLKTRDKITTNDYLLSPMRDVKKNNIWVKVKSIEKRFFIDTYMVTVYRKTAVEQFVMGAFHELHVNAPNYPCKHYDSSNDKFIIRAFKDNKLMSDEIPLSRIGYVNSLWKFMKGSSNNLDMKLIDYMHLPLCQKHDLFLTDINGDKFCFSVTSDGNMATENYIILDSPNNLFVSESCLIFCC